MKSPSVVEQWNAQLPWPRQNPVNARGQFEFELTKVIEIFGMPGDRYTTSVEEDWMTLHFRTSQDQLLFFLVCSTAQHEPLQQGTDHEF